MNELWKDIIGYEGIYKVSSFGNVYSCRMEGELKQKTTNSGYLSVILQGADKPKEFLVHRLVATAFINNDRPDATDVNHIDGNKKNNLATNLEWFTKLENQQHAFDNGKYTQSKVVYQFTKDGEYIGSFPSATKAGKAYSIDGGFISKVCRGIKPSAAGFKWSYNLPKEVVFMNFAKSLSNLSKCTQRGVAAIVTDSKLMQVYSIGLNGGPVHGINCLCELGGKETCVHAEAQAIAKMTAVDNNKVIFTTLSPCVTCAALIINTSIRKVYYSEDWKDNPGLKLLRAAGIQVVKI